jgi:ubiquinone/menaquinone biosynthesis C-methylase UbiE
VSTTTPHPHNHANMYGLARHPGHYDRVAGLLARPLYRRVLADVIAAAPAAGTVVLDVGTGPGRLARQIAVSCPTVTVDGVDLSQEMITRATATTRLEGLENVRFQVADVTSLPFADGSVNLVVSTISLHHWDDPDAGLSEIARVLAPTGRAWIYDFRVALRRPARTASAPGVDLTLESPLIGTSRLNPIGRIVLSTAPSFG